MTQNTTTSNHVLDRAAYPFQVGSAYHRKDVFGIIGLQSAPFGGNWFALKFQCWLASDQIFELVLGLMVVRRS